MTLSRNFWLTIRQALLLIVDAIETELEMPRTSELRKRIRSEIGIDPSKHLDKTSKIGYNS